MKQLLWVTATPSSPKHSEYKKRTLHSFVILKINIHKNTKNDQMLSDEMYF